MRYSSDYIFFNVALIYFLTLNFDTTDNNACQGVTNETAANLGRPGSCSGRPALRGLSRSDAGLASAIDHYADHDPQDNGDCGHGHRSVVVFFDPANGAVWVGTGSV